MNEAEGRSTLFSELNEKGDLLLELSSHLNVRERAVHLLTTHMEIMTILQVKLKSNIASLLVF